MKIRIISMATSAVGALALAGTVMAQNVPAQFVVSGAAAEKIQDFSTINLATAQRIAEACEDMAKQYAPVTIAIQDHDGNDVYVDRMDGMDYINVVTALQKAHTALSDRKSSQHRLNAVNKEPIYEELQAYQLGEFPNNGGLPIVINKQMIGVVGVGGAGPRPGFDDQICGHQGMTVALGANNVAPIVPAERVQRERKPPVMPIPKFEATMVPKTTLPAEWVVGGKAASNLHDGYQISLAAAKKVAKACRDYAGAHNGLASIYLLNNQGDYVHVERMDGIENNEMRAALLKAKTALIIREPTSARTARIRNDPTGAPRSTIWFNLYSESGGLPIVVDGQMIGVIGVAGGAGGGDENCAIEGLKAAFGDRVAVPTYPQQAANRPG